MEINNETISRLADLAKLEFDEASGTSIKEDLTRILTFVEKLQQVNTDGVEPLIYMNEDVNVLRPDVEGDTVTQKQALSNAPMADSDYFKVPRVLGGDQ
ncbi:MAG TPA: Asp-tRNA(Asn)/Glu-tRNA(Gln) amidotransferase subunit GatC [Bacteroidia bacterium]|nr:Asp-tRNA(Asn)/Glu-tRNA(Gln) amidotransferase subunit GatC [Bacteroidia bacterium]